MSMERFILACLCRIDKYSPIPISYGLAECFHINDNKYQQTKWNYTWHTLGNSGIRYCFFNIIKDALLSSCTPWLKLTILVIHECLIRNFLVQHDAIWWKQTLSKFTKIFLWMQRSPYICLLIIFHNWRSAENL